MHINNILKNYLYNKNEFITWYKNEIYIFGLEQVESLCSKKIVVKLLNFYLEVLGNNLKITKCSEKELIINGEINEIKKELHNI